MVSSYGVVDPFAVVAERKLCFEQNFDTSNSLFSTFLLKKFLLKLLFVSFSPPPCMLHFETIVCLLG